MSFTLPQLPFAKDALVPHMSVETFDYHYSKHHNTYVTNLNNLIKETKFEKMSLEEIILSSEDGMFNNAAQVWNHTFFWSCLSPKGGKEPTGALKDQIIAIWGSYDAFKEAFTKSAVSNFGSGWTWLVKNKSGKLEIVNTGNAQTPMTSGSHALLTVDVWEHAYYIDYRNERPRFLNAFWSLVNWDFAEQNFKKI